MGRFLRHLLILPGALRRRFTPAVLADIEAAIRDTEARHAGEICFATEGALDVPLLWRGMSPRERALQVFGLLRIWDTANNTGVLVYVLLADHAVEIVADRGIAARVSESDWRALCEEAQRAYRAGDFSAGSVQAIRGIARLLDLHFPDARGDANELPNQPVLL